MVQLHLEQHRCSAVPSVKRAFFNCCQLEKLKLRLPVESCPDGFWCENLLNLSTTVPPFGLRTSHTKKETEVLYGSSGLEHWFGNV